MRILAAVNKVPGGMMVVPLFIGMTINTFFPSLLKIGGFTEALSGTGYKTVLGMYLFTTGTKMTLNAAPRILTRGLDIFAKVGVASQSLWHSEIFMAISGVQHTRANGRLSDTMEGCSRVEV